LRTRATSTIAPWPRREGTHYKASRGAACGDEYAHRFGIDDILREMYQCGGLARKPRARAMGIACCWKRWLRRRDAEMTMAHSAWEGGTCSLLRVGPVHGLTAARDGAHPSHTQCRTEDWSPVWYEWTSASVPIFSLGLRSPVSVSPGLRPGTPVPVYPSPGLWPALSRPSPIQSHPVPSSPIQSHVWPCHVAVVPLILMPNMPKTECIARIRRKPMDNVRWCVHNK
jgi:hypothetical protein